MVKAPKLIAGGHSLLPIIKLRLAEPERLHRHRPRSMRCKGVRKDGDEIVIGATDNSTKSRR